MTLTTILEKTVDISLFTHIVAGFGSIILFWIPILTKKGRSIHRKVGRVYVLLMWIAIFTGLILTINKFHEGVIDAGIFLGFLVILAVRPVWHGMAILKPQRYSDYQLKYYHILLKLALFVYGIFMLIYAIYLEGKGMAMVMLFFAVLGMMAGIDAWRDFKNIAKKPNRIKGHFEGMLFSGVAGYTGFLVIGGMEVIGKYLKGNWILIPWLLPSVVGFALIFYYQKRFSKA